MLYGARYEKTFSSRREELEFQRAMAEKLLCWALRSERGLDLSTLHRERTPDGKPFFSDCPVQFSLSHCRGMVCCGLSDAPVGVDVESSRPFSQRLAERVCTQEERAWLEAQPDQERGFLSLWTLKESVMKLSGKGIAYGFQQAAFTFREGRPCFWDPEVQVSQFELPGGWIVSAASREESFSQLQMVDLT